MESIHYAQPATQQTPKQTALVKTSPSECRVRVKTSIELHANWRDLLAMKSTYLSCSVGNANPSNRVLGPLFHVP